MINRCTSNPCCGDQTYCTELVKYCDYNTFEPKVSTTDNFKRRIAILEKIAELQKELRELD